jgi:hypothetical protein
MRWLDAIVSCVGGMDIVRPKLNLLKGWTPHLISIDPHHGASQHASRVTRGVESHSSQERLKLVEVLRGELVVYPHNVELRSIPEAENAQGAGARGSGRPQARSRSRACEEEADLRDVSGSRLNQPVHVLRRVLWEREVAGESVVWDRNCRPFPPAWPKLNAVLSIG